MRNWLAAAALVLAPPGILFAEAGASNDRMTAIPAPAQPAAIVLGTGPMPGAVNGESWHTQYGSTFARNVTVATLTPFLPAKGKATGAAVIVAPGGGFRTLSMQNEGWDVARALAARGVAAFVLKYRLNQTPASLAAFANPAKPASAPRPSADPRAMTASIEPMVADSRAAFALVRSNAKRWGVDPYRIGMVGFSAGAMLAMATVIKGEEAKPAFIGNIYGGLAPLDPPAAAPPLFIALAADDPLFQEADFGLVKSWRAAGHPVELHYFENGGHGFGMYSKPTTSTGWFEEFCRWLTMHGYMAAKRQRR